MPILMITRSYCEMNEFRGTTHCTINAFSLCLDRRIMAQHIMPSHGWYENDVQEWEPENVEKLKQDGVRFWIDEKGVKWDNVRDDKNNLTNQYINNN